MPKVSVLLPVYNGQDYLRYAIDSILAQTFRDFEFLIINDGSKDASEEIIRSYNDPRIRLFSQKNIGLTLTLNRLIQEATAPLLARMDQDDWSHPDRLQLQFDYLQTHPEVKMCGSWIQAIDTQNNVIYSHKYPVTNHAIHEEMLLSNPFAHGSVMIRKSMDLEYRTEYNDAEDIDMWAQQCMIYKVANIPEILYHWRVNPDGISHSRVLQQQSAAQRVLKTYQQWYLNQASSALPPKEEIKKERRLTSFISIWNRKRKLMKIFQQKQRHDLVRREWKYLQTSLF